VLHRSLLTEQNLERQRAGKDRANRVSMVLMMAACGEFQEGMGGEYSCVSHHGVIHGVIRCFQGYSLIPHFPRPICIPERHVQMG